MADDLADFPLVVLENDYPEQIGKVGLFDYLMPVGSTGIMFTAAVPGVLWPWGPSFTVPVQQAANLRAASTLAQMGLIKGDCFAFLRQALVLSQADLATQYGVMLATVIGWENNTIPIPAMIWGRLSAEVCLKDGRNPPSDYALPVPNFRARLIRVFPNIPMMPVQQNTACQCPPPVVPCGPSKTH